MVCQVHKTGYLCLPQNKKNYKKSIFLVLASTTEKKIHKICFSPVALRDLQGARRCHADDDRPLAGRQAAMLLKARWAPAKVLGHLCDAWSVQSWDAQEDASVLPALGVGRPKPLQALNNAGYKPSYDTGRRHVEPPPPPRYAPQQAVSTCGTSMWLRASTS